MIAPVHMDLLLDNSPCHRFRTEILARGRVTGLTMAGNNPDVFVRDGALRRPRSKASSQGD